MQVKDDYTSLVQVSIASTVYEVPAGGLLAIALLLSLWQLRKQP